MVVKVLSKREFNDSMENNGINDSNVSKKNTAFISINDAEITDNHPSYFKSDHSNVLRLWFDDTEEDIKDAEGNLICKSVSEHQIKEIFEFIKRNSGKNFIVHCTAGIARSGAVGQFIIDFANGDKEEFKQMNPYILPNTKVMKLLNKLALEDLKSVKI